MIPPRCSSKSCSRSRKAADPRHPRDLTWREHANDSACNRHSTPSETSSKRVDHPPDMAFDALMDELEGPRHPTGLLAINALVAETDPPDALRTPAERAL